MVQRSVAQLLVLVFASAPFGAIAQVKSKSEAKKGSYFRFADKLYDTKDGHFGRENGYLTVPKQPIRHSGGYSGQLFDFLSENYKNIKFSDNYKKHARTYDDIERMLDNGYTTSLSQAAPNVAFHSWWAKQQSSGADTGLFDRNCLNWANENGLVGKITDISKVNKGMKYRDLEVDSSDSENSVPTSHNGWYYTNEFWSKYTKPLEVTDVSYGELQNRDKIRDFITNVHKNPVAHNSDRTMVKLREAFLAFDRARQSKAAQTQMKASCAKASNLITESVVPAAAIEACAPLKYHCATNLLDRFGSAVSDITKAQNMCGRFVSNQSEDRTFPFDDTRKKKLESRLLGDKNYGHTLGDVTDAVQSLNRVLRRHPFFRANPTLLKNKETRKHIMMIHDMYWAAYKAKREDESLSHKDAARYARGLINERAIVWESHKIPGFITPAKLANKIYLYPEILLQAIGEVRDSFIRGVNGYYNLDALTAVAGAHTTPDQFMEWYRKNRVLPKQSKGEIDPKKVMISSVYDHIKKVRRQLKSYQDGSHKKVHSLRGALPESESDHPYLHVLENSAASFNKQKKEWNHLKGFNHKVKEWMVFPFNYGALLEKIPTGKMLGSELGEYRELCEKLGVEGLEKMLGNRTAGMLGVQNQRTYTNFLAGQGLEPGSKAEQNRVNQTLGYAGNILDKVLEGKGNAKALKDATKNFEFDFGKNLDEMKDGFIEQAIASSLQRTQCYDEKKPSIYQAAYDKVFDNTHGVSKDKIATAFSCQTGVRSYIRKPRENVDLLVTKLRSRYQSRKKADSKMSKVAAATEAERNAADIELEGELTALLMDTESIEKAIERAMTVFLLHNHIMGMENSPFKMKGVDPYVEVYKTNFFTKNRIDPKKAKRVIKYSGSSIATTEKDFNKILENGRRVNPNSNEIEQMAFYNKSARIAGCWAGDFFFREYDYYNTYLNGVYPGNTKKDARRELIAFPHPNFFGVSEGKKKRIAQEAYRPNDNDGAALILMNEQGGRMVQRVCQSAIKRYHSFIAGTDKDGIGISGVSKRFTPGGFEIDALTDPRSNFGQGIGAKAFYACGQLALMKQAVKTASNAIKGNEVSGHPSANAAIRRLELKKETSIRISQMKADINRAKQMLAPISASTTLYSSGKDVDSGKRLTMKSTVSPESCYDAAYLTRGFTSVALSDTKGILKYQALKREAAKDGMPFRIIEVVHDGFVHYAKLDRYHKDGKVGFYANFVLAMLTGNEMNDKLGKDLKETITNVSKERKKNLLATLQGISNMRKHLGGLFRLWRNVKELTNPDHKRSSYHKYNRDIKELARLIRESGKNEYGTKVPRSARRLASRLSKLRKDVLKGEPNNDYYELSILLRKLYNIKGFNVAAEMDVMRGRLRKKYDELLKNEKWDAGNRNRERLFRDVAKTTGAYACHIKYMLRNSNIKNEQALASDQTGLMVGGAASMLLMVGSAMSWFPPALVVYLGAVAAGYLLMTTGKMLIDTNKQIENYKDLREKIADAAKYDQVLGKKPATNVADILGQIQRVEKDEREWFYMMSAFEIPLAFLDVHEVLKAGPKLKEMKAVQKIFEDDFLDGMKGAKKALSNSTKAKKAYRFMVDKVSLGSTEFRRNLKETIKQAEMTGDASQIKLAQVLRDIFKNKGDAHKRMIEMVSSAGRGYGALADSLDPLALSRLMEMIGESSSTAFLLMAKIGSALPVAKDGRSLGELSSEHKQLVREFWYSLMNSGKVPFGAFENGEGYRELSKILADSIGPNEFKDLKKIRNSKGTVEEKLDLLALGFNHNVLKNSGYGHYVTNLDDMRDLEKAMKAEGKEMPYLPFLKNLNGHVYVPSRGLEGPSDLVKDEDLLNMFAGYQDADDWMRKTGIVGNKKTTYRAYGPNGEYKISITRDKLFALEKLFRIAKLEGFDKEVGIIKSLMNRLFRQGKEGLVMECVNRNV